MNGISNIRLMQRIHALKGGINLMIVNLSDARHAIMEANGTDDVNHPSVSDYTEAIDRMMRLTVGQAEEVIGCQCHPQRGSVDRLSS